MVYCWDMGVEFVDNSWELNILFTQVITTQ